jgi:hypothetical protein
MTKLRHGHVIHARQLAPLWCHHFRLLEIGMKIDTAMSGWAAIKRDRWDSNAAAPRTSAAITAMSIKNFIRRPLSRWNFGVAI